MHTGRYCASSQTTTACADSTVSGVPCGECTDATSSTCFPSTTRAAVSFSTHTDTLYLTRDLRGPLNCKFISASATGVPFLQRPEFKCQTITWRKGCCAPTMTDASQAELPCIFIQVDAHCCKCFMPCMLQVGGVYGIVHLRTRIALL